MTGPTAHALDTRRVSPTISTETAQILSLIDRTLRLRRERELLFGKKLFADPAWDILLDLFAHKLRGVDVSISSLCIAAAVPTTTALRHINSLEEKGLICSRRSRDDWRVRYVGLTASTGDKLHALLCRALTAEGAPIAISNLGKDYL